LFDKEFDINERAFTYEGEEFHSDAIPIKGTHLPH